MKHYTKIALLLLSTLLVQSVYSAESQITFFHNDLLGSPVAATDESGALKWRKDYKPYGGESANSEDDGQNNIGFTGHVDDSDTGLTYMQARYYDPAIGRFLSVDPVGVLGSVEDNPMMFNRYAYANNNPYKYTDPDGNNPKLIADFALNVGINMLATGKPGLGSAAVETAKGAFNPLATLNKAQKFSKLLSSKGLKEQASGLVGKNGGKHRVTLRSEKQQLDIDLAGKSHGGVATPHTKVSSRNTQAPNQPAYNTKGGEVRSSTQQDIRTARKYLERKNK